MNIFFDLDIKFPGFYDKCSKEEQIALEAILNYVYDRVVFIHNEIEEEENQDKTPKAIMIYLMQSPRAIQPRGYSKELSGKIIGCFNDKDAELLWQSSDNALKRFLN